MESVSQNGVVQPSVPPRPRSLMKPSVPPRPHSMVRPSVPPRPHSMVRPSVPPRPHSMVRPSVPPRPHSMVRPSVPPRPHSMVKPSASSCRHSSVKAPEWKCSTCALVNEGYRKQCKSCGLLRSTKEPPKSSSSEEMGGVRRRSECAPKETPGIVSIMDSMLGFLQLATIDPNVQADSRGLPSQPQTQDQYIHRRTSTGQRRVQVSPERCEAHQQQQHSDEGQWLKESTELNPTVCLKEQHSDEGQWLKESIEPNPTVCLKETTCEDALEANTMYQRIQQYCVEVRRY